MRLKNTASWEIEMCPMVSISCMPYCTKSMRRCHARHDIKRLHFRSNITEYTQECLQIYRENALAKSASCHQYIYLEGRVLVSG